MLEAIIRRLEPATLQAIKIVELGAADAVKNGVALIRKVGHRAIGVRDADMPANAREGLYVLPGTLPPEREVFNCAAVRDMILRDFGVNVENHLAANPVDDHHDLPGVLAMAAETNETNLACCSIREYVNSLPEATIRPLVNLIRENT